MINEGKKMIKQDVAFTKPLLLTLKETKETLEKAQSLFKAHNKQTRKPSLMSFW